MLQNEIVKRKMKKKKDCEFKWVSEYIFLKMLQYLETYEPFYFIFIDNKKKKGYYLIKLKGTYIYIHIPSTTCILNSQH